MVRSDDLWYEDGSVVLQAGMRLFRVHTSILSRHSEVLKTTFSLPQAPEPATEIYEGCPLVEVIDAAIDWEHYLKAIYDWSYFRPGHEAKFEVVAAVARLSTKYETPYLRRRTIDHLLSVYPSSPMAWDSRSDSRLIPPFEGELAAYLMLAFECDIKVILPALYYSACKGPLADTLAALNSVNRSTNMDVCTPFLLGRDRLRHAETQSTLAFLIWGFPFRDCPHRCDVKEGLLRARSEALARSTVGASGEEETYVEWCITHPSWVGEHHNFCATCCEIIKDTIEEGRRNAWEKLPELFGLSDWETSKREAVMFDDPSFAK
ncbi:hypothetical protein JAAARDRAFT_143080 [Jaapia argillacea MUCL 33604]|uniref:BTB domain-containing protein n=1 Tax=Jaapia argillacea MUCL 33604 TaxID=933084 RepID=A0A067P4K0_9AGAM|nr:hypothetical protein JAAARDRAFT_143080 [Jaapia argillacea MUCL 33604]